MKLLLLGDLHFGEKLDDLWIQSIQSNAIDQAIELSKKHGITRWIQLGDVFHYRKAITHKTMEFTRTQFEKIDKAGIHVDIDVGNHDATYKNTIFPNACRELLGSCPNVTVYDRPTTVNYDGLEIDIIPWLCQENTTEILEHIKNTTASLCMGHWELNGFYFYKGLKSHGLDSSFLSGYDRVYSGHFHTRSERGNVEYIGTPYTLCAGDENDIRGFTILDTKDKSTLFVENKTTWHKKLFYPQCINDDVEEYKNLSIRVIVEEMDNKFTKFESKLEDVVHQLRIVSKIDNSVIDESDEEIDIKNVLSLMEDYVDAVGSTDEERTQLKTIVNQLYTESTN